ncbi:MAG: TIGR00296 family protein, partial [Nitrososphaeria archaeon]|nr:TIGR00296 family protein [Nitrososphaeria archaeon]
GIPYPIKPLMEAIIEASIDAATADPRFPSVTLDELERSIVIEISILTPPQEVKVSNPLDYPRHVKIGVDGLIVSKRMFNGLLLPQVALEWNMDSEEFLSNCCMKAGLTPDAWLTPDTKISKFQALIFSEETPRGKVKRVEHSEV